MLALYLETKGLGLPEIKAPKPIVRYCTQINFLSEMEGCIAFEMINSRNQTLHMYKQEIAQIIAAAVPHYYELMKNTTERMAQ